MPLNKQVRNGRGLGRILLLLSLGLLAAGCNPRGEIFGTVSYKGKLLTGGIVTFLPSAGGAFNARIQEDGSYRLSKVPSGKMKVGVVSTSSKPIRSPMVAKAIEGMKSQKRKYTKEEIEKMPPEMRDAFDPSSGMGQLVPIPPRYNNPEKSGLEYTVIEGAQEYIIELE